MNKAYEFDDIAQNVFFPAYPVIAEQIVAVSNKTTGRCLDLGSGGGHLGLSLAKITDMEVTLLDIREESITIAENRISDWKLKSRATALVGDVLKIPFDANHFDLIISRGSLWFWEDHYEAFREIYRVLQPGGITYIGGGFGSAEIKSKIDVIMKVRDPQWPGSRKNFEKDNDENKFTKILKELEIENFTITNDEKGMWIIIQKQ